MPHLKNPQPFPLHPKTLASPENIQLPILTSFSLELERVLRPDLQAKGIQVTCVNADSQEVSLVDIARKAHFAVPYDSSYFPGLYTQALPASEVYVQCPLLMYPRLQNRCHREFMPLEQKLIF